MRGGRKQRHHPDLIALCLTFFLWAGCSASPDLKSDDDLYDLATFRLRRGDFTLAKNLAETGIRTWTAEPQSLRYWKYRLLHSEAQINLGGAKDALPFLESMPPDTAEFNEIVCRSRTVLAKALYRLGRAKEASAVLDEAESIATSRELKRLLPEIQILRYALLEAMNQPDKAEAALGLALKLAGERQDSYWETLALNNLGYSRLRRFRYDEAIPILMRAEAGFRELDAKLLASAAQVNIALCATLLGDFDRALANYVSAIAIQEREGAKPYLQASLGEVGNFYKYQGDFVNAISYYQRALALALEISAFSDASKWAGNLAAAMTSIGNWDQAEKFNLQSRDLKRQINDTGSLNWTVLFSAHIAAGRGRNETAEKLFKDVIKAGADPRILWEAHAGLAQLYRSASNHSKASEHFEHAIRVIESSQAELTHPDYKITLLARLIGFYQNYVDTLIDRQEFDKALQVAESSRARVLMEKLGRRRAGQAAAKPVDYFRAAPQSGTVVLSYWLAPQRSFLWVVTPQSRRMFVLPPREEIESLVKSYLTFIQNLRDPLENGQPAADRLYEVLLGPTRELIPAGAKVVIVPDGALHNLNFEMLPVPGEKRRYWIEDVIVSVSPSIVVRPDNDSVAQLKSILLIGNPESAGADNPKLQNAGDEMRSVERRMASLQKAVYEGAKAEPAVYKTSNPQQFSVIHFAAHGAANSESPLQSAIILSPAADTFKLYARDVAQIPLQAELVTISSCRGAGARVYSGEGMVGFTWAFLQAGARHVIAGLWDVTDLSTAQLMDGLYANLSLRKSPAAALRDAKLTLIRSQGHFKKPYYWGPFQVYIGAGNPN